MKTCEYFEADPNHIDYHMCRLKDNIVNGICTNETELICELARNEKRKKIAKANLNNTIINHKGEILNIVERYGKCLRISDKIDRIVPFIEENNSIWFLIIKDSQVIQRVNGRHILSIVYRKHTMFNSWTKGGENEHTFDN